MGFDIKNVQTVQQAAQLVAKGELSIMEATDKFGQEALQEALNSNGNWGVMDGFQASNPKPVTTDEYAYQPGPSKAKNKTGKEILSEKEQQWQAEMKDQKEARREKRNEIAQNRDNGNYWEAFKGSLEYANMPDGTGVQKANALPVVGAVLMALVTMATVTSCVEVEQNVNVPIDFSSISEELKKLSAKCNELLDELKKGNDLKQQEIDNLKEQYNLLQQNFNLLLSKVDINNEELKEIKEQLKAFDEQIKEMINLLISGNADLGEIKTLLQQNNAQNVDILDAINGIKVTLDNLGDQGKQFATAILGALQKGNIKLDVLIALMSKMNAAIVKIGADNKEGMEALGKLLEQININIEKGNEQNAEMGQAILAAISRLGASMTAGLAAILKAINNGRTELKDAFNTLLGKLSTMDTTNQEGFKALSDLLVQINANIEAGNDQNAEIGKAVLDAINKLGINVAGGFKAILAKLDQMSDAQKAEFKALLAQLQKMDAKDDARTNAILAAINKLGFTITADINKVLAKIDTLGNKFTTIVNAGFDKLLKQLQTMDAKDDKRAQAMMAGFEAILEQLKKMDAKDDKRAQAMVNGFNALAVQLQKMDDKNEVRTNKIIAAIKDNGANMSAGFAAIVKAINEGNKNLGTKLDQVLAKMGQMDANQQAKFNKIIELIGNINSFDPTKIEMLLDKILKATLSNGDKLDIINATNTAILNKLKALEVKGDTRFAKLEKLLGDILTKIGQGGQGGNIPYDDTKLLNILTQLSAMIDTRLEEILEAIKDHDVKVTVDVTGKVTCECNCQGGSPHEGILGDLENLLG